MARIKKDEAGATPAEEAVSMGVMDVLRAESLRSQKARAHADHANIENLLASLHEAKRRAEAVAAGDGDAAGAAQAFLAIL